MKIMILNSLYYPYKFGGAEVSVQLLAEELVKKNHEVRVVTLNDEGSIKKEVLNGVKVISLPLKNRYWPFSSEAHSRIQKLFCT
nr:glycosyltransferase [Escherichia coli]